MSEQKFNVPNDETYNLLMNRRSVVAKMMADPGPDTDSIKQILSAGMRVPDHGKLAPWRFIVLTGDDRAHFGNLIAKALIEENETSATVAEKMKGYATQGPVLIIAVSRVIDHPVIPKWEQELSAGAACQNMLVAATALGFASQWLTGWAAFSPAVMKGLGLNENERIAGLMFFGNHGEEPTDRRRPIFEEQVTWGFPAVDSQS